MLCLIMTVPISLVLSCRTYTLKEEDNENNDRNMRFFTIARLDMHILSLIFAAGI